MVKAKDQIDAALCEPLARQAVAGDSLAWKKLVAHVWPSSLRIVRSKMRRAPPEHVENVVINVLGKLGDDGGHGLKLYAPWQERNPDKTFADWFRIALARATLDYVRAHKGELVEPGRDDPSAKRLLNEFTSSGVVEEIGERPAITAAQTARQLLSYAARHLPEDQHRALVLWLDEGTFDEIAADLALEGPDAAQKYVRAAIAVLRRQFAGQK